MDDILSAIAIFKNSIPLQNNTEMKELEFTVTLSAEERFKLHQLVREHNLYSKSEKDGTIFKIFKENPFNTVITDDHRKQMILYYDLPITLYQENYFGYFVNLYDNILSTKKIYQMLMEAVHTLGKDFDNYAIGLIDKIVTKTKNNNNNISSSTKGVSIYEYNKSDNEWPKYYISSKSDKNKLLCEEMRKATEYDPSLEFFIQSKYFCKMVQDKLGHSQKVEPNKSLTEIKVTIPSIEIPLIEIKSTIEAPIVWKKYVFKCTPLVVSAARAKDHSQSFIKLLNRFQQSTVLNALNSINNTSEYLEEKFPDLVKSYDFLVKGGLNVISDPFRIAVVYPEGTSDSLIINELLSAVQRGKQIKEEMEKWLDDLIRVELMPINEDIYDFTDADIIFTPIESNFNIEYLKSFFSLLKLDIRCDPPLIAFLTPYNSKSLANFKWKTLLMENSFSEFIKFCPPLLQSSYDDHYKELIEKSIFITAAAPLADYSGRLDLLLDKLLIDIKKPNIDPLLTTLGELDNIFTKNDDARESILHIVKKRLILPDFSNCPWELSFIETFKNITLDPISIAESIVTMCKTLIEWVKDISKSILKNINESGYDKFSSIVISNLSRLNHNFERFLLFDVVKTYKQIGSDLIKNILDKKESIIPFLKSFHISNFDIINKFTKRLERNLECITDLHVHKKIDISYEDHKALLVDIRDERSKLINYGFVLPFCPPLIKLDTNIELKLSKSNHNKKIPLEVQNEIDRLSKDGDNFTPFSICPLGENGKGFLKTNLKTKQIKFKKVDKRYYAQAYKSYFEENINELDLKGIDDQGQIYTYREPYKF